MHNGAIWILFVTKCFQAPLSSVISGIETISIWVPPREDPYQTPWAHIVRRWPQLPSLQGRKQGKYKRKREISMNCAWTSWLLPWETGAQSTGDHLETLWNMPQNQSLGRMGRALRGCYSLLWPLSPPSWLMTWHGIRGSPWPEEALGQRKHLPSFKGKAINMPETSPVAPGRLGEGLRNGGRVSTLPLTMTFSVVKHGSRLGNCSLRK